MRELALKATLGCFVLCLSSCGDGGPTESEEKAERAALPAAGDAHEMGGSIAEPANDRSGASVEQATEAPRLSTAGPGGDLNAYVGKFPFEAVGGVTWHDHPLVTAGIRKTLTDAAVRRAMQAPGGPSAPIAIYQGKVGSWGCEQHNCGDHQWAVLVDPVSGATDVCYYNAEQTAAVYRWYIADGTQETRPGNCSVV